MRYVIGRIVTNCYSSCALLLAVVYGANGFTHKSIFLTFVFLNIAYVLLLHLHTYITCCNCIYAYCLSLCCIYVYCLLAIVIFTYLPLLHLHMHVAYLPISRHTVVCRAAQEASAPPVSILTGKKKM